MTGASMVADCRVMVHGLCCGDTSTLLHASSLLFALPIYPQNELLLCRANTEYQSQIRGENSGGGLPFCWDIYTWRIFLAQKKQYHSFFVRV